ncbi:T9SS type A sorting domain-containing protein [Flavobacterium pedocola]
MIRIIKVLLVCFFTVTVLGQAPDISYTTPNVFALNQAITPLLPNNAGGTIPNEPIVSTLAGSGSVGSTDATSVSASFNFPTVVSLNGQNDIIVVDRSNHKIRKITPVGVVTTLAGTGAAGAANGATSVATFRYPDGAIVDSQGNILISDQSNHRIRKITPTGTVSTLAGSTAGYLDGVGTAAKFYYPAAMAIDPQDNLYVADWNNHKIRKVTPDGTVTTYAGSTSGYQDGTVASAKFNGPTGLGLDTAGNLYVADYSNHRIRKIDTSGQVTTIAGNGAAGVADGLGINASFNNPALVAVASDGSLFVTDEGNNKIRKISITGDVSTFAGTGAVGATDGTASSASFKNPTGICVAPNNTLYVSDYGNHKIRKIKSFGYSIAPSLPDGLSFNPVTGEISGTPTMPTPSAQYTVTASNADGVSTFVLTIEVTATLVAHHWNNTAFKVYPNPVKDKVIVTAENQVIKNLALWNVLGQKIKSEETSQQTVEVDLSQIQSGIYICRIASDLGEQEIKIIKE